MMKKVFHMICIAAIIATGCEKTERPDLGGSCMTLEQVIEADYAHIKEVSAGSQVYFYETECVLNGIISGMEARDVKVLFSTSIAAAGYNVYFFETNFETGTTVESSVRGSWAGSFTIPDPTEMSISFDEAVGILLGQTAIPVPASDKMTFRHPQGTLPNPLYIFGSNHTHYAGVDAVTGTVYLLSGGDDPLGGSIIAE